MYYESNFQIRIKKYIIISYLFIIILSDYISQCDLISYFKTYFSIFVFFYRNSELISHNLDFVSRNSEFTFNKKNFCHVSNFFCCCCNFAFISHNSEFISCNSDFFSETWVYVSNSVFNFFYIFFINSAFISLTILTFFRESKLRESKS